LPNQWVETNPGNARVLVQRHGERDVWLNPPPIPESILPEVMAKNKPGLPS
jgi:hypothetical protein